MKRAFFPLILTIAGFLAGCNKSGTPPAAATDATPSDDGWVNVDKITGPQPKLPTLRLYLGPAILDAEMAITPREEEVGMMYRTNIQDTDGMIFNLGGPMRASFWMKNCPESISAAYISPDGTIQEIHHLEQNDTNAVYSVQDNIQFVLETQDGWFQHHNIGVGTKIISIKGPLVEALRPQ